MQQANAQVIPSLATLAILPQATFAAFKAEEKISFVRPYDPRTNAIEGMRHAVIRYRNVDAKAVQRSAQMVTVPQLALSDEYLLPDVGAKILLGVLEDGQDAIIRALVDSGVSNISWDVLSLEKVYEALTAVRISNRLTKEQIEGWAKIAFLVACNTRADQISESKSYDAAKQLAQRAGTLNAYVELACKLAAPVPNVGREQLIALKNMMAVAKIDDDLSRVLSTKIEALLNPKILENGDL